MDQAFMESINCGLSLEEVNKWETVHLFASVYHWTYQDYLNMPPEGVEYLSNRLVKAMEDKTQLITYGQLIIQRAIG